MANADFTDTSSRKSVTTYIDLSDAIVRLAGLEMILRNSRGSIEGDNDGLLLLLADSTARIAEDVCKAADCLDNLHSIN